MLEDAARDDGIFPLITNLQGWDAREVPEARHASNERHLRKHSAAHHSATRREDERIFTDLPPLLRQLLTLLNLSPKRYGRRAA